MFCSSRDDESGADVYCVWSVVRVNVTVVVTTPQQQHDDLRRPGTQRDRRRDRPTKCPNTAPGNEQRPLRNDQQRQQGSERRRVVFVIVPDGPVFVFVVVVLCAVIAPAAIMHAIREVVPSHRVSIPRAIQIPRVRHLHARAAGYGGRRRYRNLRVDTRGGLLGREERDRTVARGIAMVEYGRRGDGRDPMGI